MSDEDESNCDVGRCERTVAETIITERGKRKLCGPCTTAYLVGRGDRNSVMEDRE